jgi:hypothetical protein
VLARRFPIGIRIVAADDSHGATSGGHKSLLLSKGVSEVVIRDHVSVAIDSQAKIGQHE